VPHYLNVRTAWCTPFITSSFPSPQRKHYKRLSLAIESSDLSCPLTTMAPSTFGATAQAPVITEAHPKDPYQYQLGFGNRFASEALCVLSVLLLAQLIQAPSFICARTGPVPYRRVRICPRRSSMTFTLKAYVFPLSTHFSLFPLSRAVY
jgi:hypothetical protein